MKILMICDEIPNSFNTLSHRELNSIEHLTKKWLHSITLISFKYSNKASQYDWRYLMNYCDKIVTVDLPSSSTKRLVYYAKNYINGIFSADLRNILHFRLCSREMQIKINDLVKKEDFDVIFVNVPYMLFYVSNINLPKILEIWTIPQLLRECYTLEKKTNKKLATLMRYFEIKNYEKYYTKFDICITPTEQDRDILCSYLPDLDISVIPYGINVEFTNKDFIKSFPEDFPSLIFTGDMGGHLNQRSILDFYDRIYPAIKKVFPNIKLYIVGKNPSRDIIQMTRDKSVIVTGYVEDLRPYLARASVVTLPIHGYGIKTRLLEAMAVGKPVITSSAGIHGIGVTPEENIIIADDAKEFARRVIELLNDEELRNRIGANAKKLMEEEYSWENMTDKLNEVFKEVVREHENKKSR